MAWFRCLICGENLPGQLISEQYLIGFYLTRFVEATDAANAESIALQRLRNEPKLAQLPKLAARNTVRVFFESIDEVDLSSVPAIEPGFIFFPMEDTKS